MPKPTSRKSGWQTSIWQTFLAGAIVAAVAVGGSSSALAASGSWRGTTNASWATTGNWSGASPPTTGETATFNGAGNGNTTIDLGTSGTVGTLLFDSANAAAYTIGSGAVGSQTLTTGNYRSLSVNSTVTNNQLFNANVVLGDSALASHFITNASTSATLTLAGNVSGGTGGTAGVKTLFAGGAGNTTISGTIGRGGATSLALNKTGAGTLTLSGSNTYNGATTLNQGTINLDFSAATAPAANILSSSGGALTFTGGTLRLTGKASTANSQAVASTTVGSGNSSLVLNANSATSLLLNLNAISRSAGGTLDLSLPAGTASSTNGVRTTTTTSMNSVLATANSNGIAYATVGGTDWAGLSGGNIVAMTTYQTGNANYTTNNNVDVANGDTPASGITVNTLRFNGNNTLNLSGTNTVNTGGILVTNAATTGATISGGTLISGGGRELVLINNGAQLTVGSVIADSSGASRLTISGTGTTVLNGINTYTGATNINGGRARLGSSQALGVNSTVTLSNNASSILDLNGNNVTINGLEAQGTRIQQGVADPTNQNYEVSSASVAIGSGTLTVGSGGATSTFGGTLAGTGELVKVGTGGLTLHGDNTGFTGNFTIKAGTVTAGGGQGNTLGTGTITLGDSAGGSDNVTLRIGGPNNTASRSYSYSNNIVLASLTTGTLTIEVPHSNGTTTLSGTTTGNNSLIVRGNGGSLTLSQFNNSGNLTFSPNLGTTQSGGGSIGSNVQNVRIAGASGGTFNWSQSINNSGTITNSFNGTTTISGSITSASRLVQNSTSGTFTISAVNTFTGDTFIQSGTLTLGNNLALQNSGVDTSGAGEINATSRTALTFGGLIGSKDVASVITTNYSGIGGLTLNPQSGKSYTYSGNIANGALNMTLTKSGSGTQVLSGSNSYSGATTVSAGMLQLGAVNSLYGGTTANWTATNIRTGSGATLAFNVGGTGEFTTGNVTTLLTNLGSSSSATNGMNAGSFLGFDTTNASGGTFTIADAIANSGGSSGGARGLRKLGTGTLLLAGTSTYTGPTIVSQGGLLVNGQLGNTAVTVQSGGLLGGAGTLLGAVSVQAGGTFSPGNSPGLLSTGELVLAGATLMEIDGLSPSRGVNYDAVNVSGQLTYGGSLLIDFGPLITTAFADNTIFDLFDFTSHTGAFTSITTANDGSWYAGLTFASTGNGDTWKAEKGSQTLEFTYSTGNLVIVPEPGAIALAGIGIAAAAYALCSRSPSRKRAG